MEQTLKKAFYDPIHPGSYSGVSSLYKALKKEGHNISADEVHRFLSGQDTYTLHKPARVHFKRNRVFVSGL